MKGLYHRKAVQGLRLVLGFDAWHVNHGLPSPYVRAAEAMISSVRHSSPDAIVDVGCGLGTLLRTIGGGQLYGYDIDAAVIRAARLMSVGRHITYRVGSLSEVATDFRSVSVLCCLNWPHVVEPLMLSGLFRSFFSSVSTDYLLVDRVPSPPYKWQHSWPDICGRDWTEMQRAHGFEYGRELVLMARSR